MVGMTSRLMSAARRNACARLATSRRQMRATLRLFTARSSDLGRTTCSVGPRDKRKQAAIYIAAIIISSLSSPRAVRTNRISASTPSAGRRPSRSFDIAQRHRYYKNLQCASTCCAEACSLELC